MVRYRKKKSLYEVMTGAGRKLSYDKNLEKVHPDQPPQQSPPTPPLQQSPPTPLPQQNPPTPLPQRFTAWPTKPKPFQLNAGRIEISLPYQIAIAIALAVILLLLITYRLGQYTSPHAKASDATLDNTAGKKSQVSSNSVTTISQTAQQPKLTATQSPQPLPAEQTGNNRIVIQTYKLRSHLEPVKQYFAQFGIETEIIQVGEWYYLVTKNKYDNPQKPGTSGFYARQKIIELGANYKAPPGFEPFGDKPFSDAFGMKFDQ